jgi:hypothetical protein
MCFGNWAIKVFFVLFVLPLLIPIPIPIPILQIRVHLHFSSAHSLLSLPWHLFPCHFLCQLVGHRLAPAVKASNPTHFINAQNVKIKDVFWGMANWGTENRDVKRRKEVLMWKSKSFFGEWPIGERKTETRREEKKLLSAADAQQPMPRRTIAAASRRRRSHDRTDTFVLLLLAWLSDGSKMKDEKADNEREEGKSL